MGQCVSSQEKALPGRGKRLAHRSHARGGAARKVPSAQAWGWMLVGLVPAPRALQHVPMRLGLLGFFLIAAAAHAAPSVGWVRASGQLEPSAPARYTPLNLLDGLPDTVWCSRNADALSESISFGFADVVTLTRLDITTGNAASPDTFHAFSRVRKLLLKGPDGTATVTLEDRLSPQPVQLAKPLKGKHFTLEVLDTFSAEDPLAPACLADVLPYSGTTALAGPALKKRLGYEPGRSEVLGLWYAGPDGSPDSTLTFFLDGSWHSAPEGPSGKMKPLSGKWWTKAGELWLSIPGMGKVAARAHVSTKQDASGKPLATLSFEGQVGELKQTFRDRR